jgi:predicted GH43/DUF377 family glycosyl hydrolase
MTPKLNISSGLFGLMVLFIIGCAEQQPNAPAGPDTSTVSTWQIGPFEKHIENPIITPQGSTWESKDVFNPAAWTDGEQIYLLYRAEDSTGIGQWNGTSRIGLATSRDGIHFEREPEPILGPTEDFEFPGGVEDPRLVKIDDTFYLTYTAYDGTTARLALATSKDLHTWEKHGPMLPDLGWTKSGAILDTPIDGTYWMYFGDAGIYAAHSTDLLNWTPLAEPVLPQRPGKFDSRVVEPGPPPILTDHGILMLYNGADDDLLYVNAQALLDPNDPSKIIERPETPFMRPTTELEKTGQIPNVVFIEGLVQFKGQWFLYFGMGDSGIGVATASVQ